MPQVEFSTGHLKKFLRADRKGVGEKTALGLLQHKKTRVPRMHSREMHTNGACGKVVNGV
jgi:hypothetical protein